MVYANAHNACWIKCSIDVSEDILEMDLQNSIAPYIEEEKDTKGIGILHVKRRLKYNYQETI